MEENVVYVLDKQEQLIAVFNKEDKDTLINPRIVEIQNAEATFTFSINPKNEKWEQIKNPENLYMVNGKVFSTNFEGCFEEIISDNGEDLITVKAYEAQKLLSRKYVRAWNSTTGFENIDIFMVVILSNGNLDLYNNDVLIESEHLKGTSGYVLDGLLYGTGWKTGTCDVEGIFDFETDQVDIYENILKVQSIWGGILVFDSFNKIVHHRDETKFLPYNGYEVKAEKNMQSLEKMHNNKIITKLCPLGEGGLNIKSVNDDSEWLINNSYTDSVLEGIENNPDIYEPDQLKRWGERILQDLCKPRKELTVKLALLNQKEGYELETIELNDVVEVFNYNESNKTEQLRVVSYDYGIWDYSDAVVELSDVTLESTDIFKKNVQASNNINDGTLDAERIVVFKKNGKSLSNIILNIDDTIIQTKSDLELADNRIKASVEQITSNVDSLNDQIVSQQSQLSSLSVNVGNVEALVKETNENNEERFADLELTIKGLNLQVSNVNGNNLIKNSDMANGTSFWLKHLSRSFAEGPTPPTNPQPGDYWYCTEKYQSYKEAQMYYYNGTEWTESTLTRKQLEQTQNLLAAVSSYENDYTKKYTLSGRMIKFDADDESISTHLFTATNFSDYKENQEACALGFKIKNSLKTGFVFITMAFYHKTLQELESSYASESLEAMYSKDIILTPDDLTNLSNVQMVTKTPKKSDFIPVYVNTTPPVDTTKKWMDNSLGSICILKEYDEETQTWVQSNTTMSCYDEVFRNVYFWTNYVGGAYTPSTINYDENEIKSVAVAITAYGGFLINFEPTRPEILPKGWYWIDQSEGGFAWRTQYNGDEFVGWKQTDITTKYIQENTVSSPPFPSIYQVRPTGFFEIADLKLEWNSLCTAWNRYAGEVYSKNYRMDENGFTITSGAKELFMDEDEIISTASGEKKFELTEEGMYAKKTETFEVNIGKYILKEAEIYDENYLVLY